jgi:hypothetical protein
MLTDRITLAQDGSATLAGRLLSRLHAGSLDRALAAGADPASSPQLRIRAQELTATPRRADLAESIDRLLVAAAGGGGTHRPLARISAIEANRPLRRSVSQALRGASPAPVRGVALVSTLLTDATGPLYVTGGAQEVAETLEEAQRSLTLAAAA